LPLPLASEYYGYPKTFSIAGVVNLVFDKKHFLEQDITRRRGSLPKGYGIATTWQD
jgi:hypothetical protein